MIPIQALMGHINKNIGLFSSPAWLSYAVYRRLKKSFFGVVWKFFDGKFDDPFWIPIDGFIWVNFWWQNGRR